MNIHCLCKCYLIPSVLTVACASPLQARLLGPGESETVNAGTPAESWTLTGATLTVTPGAITQSIAGGTASTLIMDGATTDSTVTKGVSLSNSTATIAGSTITSSVNFGLELITNNVTPGTGNTAAVSSTVITGAVRGVNLTFRSQLDLTDSQVIGTGSGTGGPSSGGLGMTVVGATANLKNSSVTGANRGVILVTDQFAGSNLPVLTLDNSSVVGTNGDAILVVGDAAITTASITVQNGSTLTAGNGIILNVAANALADLIVDNSQLNGDVSAVAASTTNITLRNSASLTGNLSNISSVNMDNSSVTGDVTVPAASTASIAMTNNSGWNGQLTNIASLNMNSSSLTGNLSNISSVNMDNSTVTGDVTVPAASTASVAMTNNSSWNGQLTNIGSLTLDNSTLTGGVNQDSGSIASVTLTNNAVITGQLNNIGALNINSSTMTGDIVQDASTPATITLANTGVLSGTVTNAQAMNIDSTSVWNMTNSSSLGSLAIAGGTVNLRGGNPAFKTLTLGSLSGSGNFALGTDLAAHQSDLINITGNATGSHVLQVQNTGVDPVKETYAQQLVHTGSGDAAFSVQGDTVDAGAFTYQLEQRGTDWFLVQAQDDAGEPIPTPSAQTVVALFSAAPTVWYGELSTLRSRMGELRNGHDQGGAWARTYGNRFNIATSDGVDYSQNQSGISLGVDTALPSSNGQWLIGVMAGYSHSDLNLRRGSTGDVDSYYAGLYSTWLSTSGYYVDAVLKANRFSNKADARMSDGERSEGDYDTYGVGASVEAGKHIQLADRWFVEPYAQVSALWVEGEDYRLDNGLEADSNRADSFLGKVGTHFGRTFPLTKGGFVQPYAKVAIAQEFAKNNKVNVNDNTFNNDLSGTRGEVGIGVVAQLTSVLQLHADIDHSNGDNIEQPWGVNAGLRYSW
ncbi:autotransporter outer membrane beta-barrel domain-containing protein [Pseudomonas quasicaspiana]|uniref:autotransporter outer membrane beta-barrel domain-containing protein n=1 Tax=Pseudomonas quasicaspiana TaxID=2829821 RepID=UPI001E2AF7A9|nr:autotransporter outer membrane beta-barrel domain-containing protein [Pseudomonas quasicaspiana]MCD5980956.1 autotransporter outer membrane beta-barrel domain-containing protein [Pseudomonas quasicaspiana]